MRQRPAACPPGTPASPPCPPGTPASPPCPPGTPASPPRQNSHPSHPSWRAKPASLRCQVPATHPPWPALGILKPRAGAAIHYP
eukprot:15439500-Alexandrium_andersonii.AAC.1